MLFIDNEFVNEEFMDKKDREKVRIKAREYDEFVNEFFSNPENLMKINDISSVKTQIVLDDEKIFKSETEKKNNPVCAESMNDSGQPAPMDIKTEILMDDAPAQIGASSVIGKRQSQQDSVIFPDQKNMFVDEKSHFICALSDGMGGLSGGERASKIAVNVIFEDFYKIFKKETTNISYEKFFDCESNKINDLVLDLTDAQGNPIRSGATLISAIVDGEDLYYLNIGDSRIYLFRNGNLTQLTKDQNYLSVLMEKVAAGEITAEQANAHPKKEALISYCGIKELTLKEINSRPLKLKANDVIMLCSDGLYRLMSTEEISSILESTLGDMNLAAYRLTAAVNNKNYRGQDNTSVILIKIN